MPDIADALFEDRHGTLMVIEVTAGGKSEVFPAGYNGWRKAIGCRVTAAPHGGKANRAILELIARTLDIPVSSVRIQSGASSCMKRIFVTGISKKDLLIRIPMKK